MGPPSKSHLCCCNPCSLAAWPSLLAHAVVAEAEAEETQLCAPDTGSPRMMPSAITPKAPPPRDIKKKHMTPSRGPQVMTPGLTECQASSHEHGWAKRCSGADFPPQAELVWRLPASLCGNSLTPVCTSVCTPLQSEGCSHCYPFLSNNV